MLPSVIGAETRIPKRYEVNVHRNEYITRDENGTIKRSTNERHTYVSTHCVPLHLYGQRQFGL